MLLRDGVFLTVVRRLSTLDLNFPFLGDVLRTNLVVLALTGFPVLSSFMFYLGVAFLQGRLPSILRRSGRPLFPSSWKSTFDTRSVSVCVAVSSSATILSMKG